MRDDFIADIDQLEARTGKIAREARYHLELLDVEDCRQVIGAPAAAFGYTYDDSLMAEMLAALPTEESRVEPGHIQIVCERLWEEFGRRIRTATRAEVSSLPRIGHDDVAGENWVRDILGNHFDEFLGTYGDVLDRIEILDMLDPLIMLGRTRNIVEQGQLIDARFRRSDLRAKLLEQLRRAKIVRVEARLGGRFVEITHEFLISSVMEAIHGELGRNQKWQDLRAALQRLERIERAGSIDPDSNEEPEIFRHYFVVVDEEQPPIMTTSRPAPSFAASIGQPMGSRISTLFLGSANVDRPVISGPMH